MQVIAKGRDDVLTYLEESEGEYLVGRDDSGRLFVVFGGRTFSGHARISTSSGEWIVQDGRVTEIREADTP